jgi:gliding motility-associated-like protein
MHALVCLRDWPTTPMKKLFLYPLLLAACPLVAQNGPIDFEPNGIGQAWFWKVFEDGSNPPLEFVANPDPDPNGYNPSPTVAKFTALPQGAPFAGCETQHGAGVGTFTIDNSNKIIRVMVYKNTISDVGVKLVRFDSWSLGEIKVANTKINEWEQLEFDFSDHFGLTYDQLVFFPDFRSRSQTEIIYFDNIFGEQYTPVPPAPDEATLELPTIFTPNGDGVNDLYAPKMSFADWAEWEVFTRNGQRVFYGQTVDATWDGTVNGRPAPAGVYFVRARCGNADTSPEPEAATAVHLQR